MTEDKLILTVHKNTITQDVIRIDSKAMAIIRQIQAESGLSAKYIVSKMVKFAADKVEIKEM